MAFAKPGSEFYRERMELVKAEIGPRKLIVKSKVEPSEKITEF